MHENMNITASDRQGSNIASWRAVSSHSSHHPQKVLLVQFSLYVYKCGLNTHSLSFHLRRGGCICCFAVCLPFHKISFDEKSKENPAAMSGFSARHHIGIIGSLINAIRFQGIIALLLILKYHLSVIQRTVTIEINSPHLI